MAKDLRCHPMGPVRVSTHSSAIRQVYVEIPNFELLMTLNEKSEDHQSYQNSTTGEHERM